MTRIWLPLLLAFFLNGCASRCALRGGEKLEFYPTYGFQSGDGASWTVPVRGRLYEPHDPSAAESTSLRLVRNLASLTSASDELARIEERTAPFRARGREGRTLSLDFAQETRKLPKTGEAGEIRSDVQIPASRVASSSPTASGARWTSYSLKGCENESAGLTGQALLIEPSGVSVIADVDDTLKVTGVGNRPAFVANTFLRPFKPIPGMSAVFQRWQDKGAQFHYFSIVPWQMYGSLSRFLSDEGFPQGVLHLRTLAWKAGSANPLTVIDNVASLFNAPVEEASNEIEALFARFPGRKFVLVGHVDGRAPELFARMARRHPDQVQLIAIRDANPEANKEKLDAAFSDLPAEKWRTFEKPADLNSVL